MTALEHGPKKIVHVDGEEKSNNDSKGADRGQHEENKQAEQRRDRNVLLDSRIALAKE